MAKKFAAAAVAASLSVATGTAQAQWLFSPWQPSTIVTKEDVAAMRMTLLSDIHGRRVDTAAAWSNPLSGNTGTVTLLHRFARNAKRCEQIEYCITPPQPAVAGERYVFVSCLQRDGSWKLEG